MKFILSVIVCIFFFARASFGQEAKPIYRLAPNPVEDITELHFDGENSKPTNLKVYDLIGNPQNVTYTYTNNNEIRIEAYNLRPGVYFLIFVVNNRTESIKFLKAK
jgi:hypothetical protein